MAGVASPAVAVLLCTAFPAPAEDLLAQIPSTPATEPDRPLCFTEDRAGQAIGVEAVARIESSHGSVRIQSAGAEVFRPGPLDAVICPNEALLTGDKSRAAIVLFGLETVLRLDENTKLVLPAPPEPGRGLVDLLTGALHFLSRVERTLDISTPFVNAGVEGTEAYVGVDEELSATFVTVFEGSVTVDAGLLASPVERGRVRLGGGQTLLGRLDRAFAVATPETVPARYRPLVAEPGTAVRWAIYYPPVLFGPPTAASAPLLEAGALLEAGRLEEAEAVLAALPDTPDVTAGKLALRTVIAVAQNRGDDALDLGRRAVAASPRSAAAKIALSYAEQADFDLEAARDLLLAAIEDEPDNALAWARLAELWLSLGYAGRSREAAATATTLADIGLTNTILGFAELASLDPAAVQSRFEQALLLDDQNPLTRLGLGLTRIRRGELAEGRQDLEIAASLDPLDSIVRSYLGRAYFEELRGRRAGPQFAQAKALDEADPTPWLYDAILKQSENRPVEALESLQRSIELNGNRALYRSRQLLDDDLATRGAKLGTIYNNLGFEQLAIVEGSRSLNADPSNYSAHRLLADTYRSLPRHEIATDSELLQSQLLQPINIDPVQPRLADNGITFLDVGGVTDFGLNEFSPLFSSNQVRLYAEGIWGSQDTLADNIIFSGIHQNASFSIGQFHFETDGTRENNDLRQNIYNAFGQLSFGNGTSVQAELRSVDEDFGDRRLLFDPDNILLESREKFTLRSARLGFRHAFSPGSDLIAAYTYSESEDDFDPFPFFGVTTDEDTHFLEIRQLYQTERMNLTGGFGYYRGDVEQSIFIDPVTLPEESSRIEHVNGYIYGNIDIVLGASLALGLSADSFESGVTTSPDRDQINPKAGFTWDIAASTTLRAAVFRSLKRTVVSSQTIEPTQIEGFNQFFDDANATDAWRYGIALDHRFTPDIHTGLEFSKRDLTVPVVEVSGTGTRIVDMDWDEQFARAYYYWTPADDLALSAGYEFERFERDPRAQNPEALAESTTHRAPVEMRYFTGSGFFASARGTYVHQVGRFADATGAVVRGSDAFWVFDASLGYRFPNRRGLLSVEARNLFDERFNYQDTDPENSTISPEFTILARLRLAF